MNDWIGNSKSAFTTIGATGHSLEIREQNDYYATPPEAIDKIFNSTFFTPPSVVWECACGQGHMAESLKSHGCNVVSTDLIDRGYGIGGIDFLKELKTPNNVNVIMTNPPYKYACEFILHGLKILPDKGRVIMLLKNTFFAGKKRYYEIYSKYPPKYVYPIVSRITCAKNGDFKRYEKSGAIDYTWFEWEKGFNGYTQIHWLQ